MPAPRALEQVISEAVVAPAARPVAVVPTCAHQMEASPYEYEVQLLLQGVGEPRIAQLRDTLLALGGSLVIIGGDGLHKVHVRVDDTDAVLAAAAVAGETSAVEITRFADQRPVWTAEG